MKWFFGIAAALVVAATMFLSAGPGSAGVDCPIDVDADECDDLSVSKTAGTVLDADGDEVLAGGTIVYTIEVCNNGEAGATGVTFTDQLPLGTHFQSSSAADFHLAFGETESQVVGTFEGELLGCSTAFISVTAADDAPCGLNLDNVVVATSDQREVTPRDNTAGTRTTVTCPEPEPEPTPAPSTPAPRPSQPEVGTGDGSVGPPPPTNGGNGAGQSGQCTGPAAERPTSCQSPGGVSGK